MILSASAQEAKPKKNVKIEFGIGLNFSGPQQQMGDLMKNYGYDDTQKNWFKIFNSKDYITYPIYSDAGFNTHISCSYRLAQRSQLGIIVNYSFFGEVDGYSYEYGYLDIRLSNLSLIPLYTYDLKDYLELQVGPGLMINSGNKYTIGLPATNEQYTSYTLGLFTGLNIKIWDHSLTFGKIGANYLLTTDSKMGPYSSQKIMGGSQMLPESKINFSRLNFFFAFGFNL